jgi:hypothetical protein
MILTQVIVRESEGEPVITVVVSEIGECSAFERVTTNNLVSALRGAGREQTGEPVRVAECKP